MAGLTLDAINLIKQGQQAISGAVNQVSNIASQVRAGVFPNLAGTSIGGAATGTSDYSIPAFLSNLAGADFALTTHFVIAISHPQAPKKLLFAASSSTLPGYVINTFDVRRYGVGPTYSYPVTNVNPDISVNFYCDASGDILGFLQGWANQVFNMQVNDSQDSEPYYVAGYKSEYAAVGQIQLLDRPKNMYAMYQLKNLYPTLIGNAELAWGDSQILRVPVSFKYDSYKFTRASAVVGADASQTQPGILADIRSAFGEVSSAFTQVQSIQSAVNATKNQINSFNLSNIF